MDSIKIKVNFAMVLLLLTTTFPIIQPVSSVQEMFCGGLGYHHGKGNGASALQIGLKTMGFTSFFSYKKAWNNIWGMNPADSSAFHDITGMEVYAVKGKAADGSCQTLNGWLLLKLVKAKHSKFISLAVWAVTDTMEPYGEFVHGSYTTNTPPLTQANFFPCSATPINSPTNPNMFVLKREGADNVQDVRVLWKADVSYCNNPKSFRFMVITNSDAWNNYPIYPSENDMHKLLLIPEPPERKFGALIYYTNSFEPKFYGAARDARPDIKCGTFLEPVHVKKPVWLNNLVKPGGNWSIAGLLEKAADKPYYEPRWFWDTPAKTSYSENLTVVHARGVCKAKYAHSRFEMFGGRCERERLGATGRVSGTHDTPPKCSPGLIPLVTGGLYYDYLDTREKNLTTVGCQCPGVPSKKEVIASRSFHQEYAQAQAYNVEGQGCLLNRTDKQYNELGLCKDSTAGRHAYGVRNWHAVSTLLATMVFVPVSCFMARYMKGEIPNAPLTDNPHLPVRKWYIAHILMTLPISCMYLTSMRAITRETEILGPSVGTYTRFHRIFGNTIMCTFAFLCVSGFHRPIRLGPRKVAIYLHLLCGYTVYYGGAILCILTYRIPASPLSYVSVLDPRFTSVLAHFGPLIMIVWLFVDVMFHVFTQVYIIKYERSQLEVDISICYYFPIIVPRRMNYYHLRFDEEMQKLHRNIQRISFIHIAVSFIFYTSVLISMTLFKNDSNHGFGWMQCTHSSKGEYIAGLDRNLSSTDPVLLHQKGFCADL